MVDDFACVFSANIIHANITGEGDKRRRKIYMKSPQPDASFMVGFRAGLGSVFPRDDLVYAIRCALSADLKRDASNYPFKSFPFFGSHFWSLSGVVVRTFSGQEGGSGSIVF